MWAAVAVVLAWIGWAWVPWFTVPWWLCEVSVLTFIAAWLADLDIDMPSLPRRRPHTAPEPVAAMPVFLPEGVASIEAWRERPRPAQRPAAALRRRSA